MARSVAIFPGSFDPVTHGHTDIIARGARLFDEVVVAVGHNPEKQTGWFTVDDRVALIESACATLANVRVVPFTGLLVSAAASEGATVVLRGLRTASDFESESRNGLANRDMTGIETLFLLADPQRVFISSSIVKDIASNGGDVSRYVPTAVNEAIRARLLT
jgi:pantetheine-phosphate adenylyltransferase